MLGGAALLALLVWLDKAPKRPPHPPLWQVPSGSIPKLNHFEFDRPIGQLNDKQIASILSWLDGAPSDSPVSEGTFDAVTNNLQAQIKALDLNQQAMRSRFLSLEAFLGIEFVEARVQEVPARHIKTP